MGQYQHGRSDNFGAGLLRGVYWQGTWVLLAAVLLLVGSLGGWLGGLVGCGALWCWAPVGLCWLGFRSLRQLGLICWSYVTLVS